MSILHIPCWFTGDSGPDWNAPLRGDWAASLSRNPLSLFVDNLVPYNNPQESYRYYSLKFCRPDPIHHKSQTLGEVLQGSEKVYSGYNQAPAMRSSMGLGSEGVLPVKLTCGHSLAQEPPSPPPPCVSPPHISFAVVETPLERQK